MSVPASLDQVLRRLASDMRDLKDRLAPDNPTMSIIKALKNVHLPGVTISSQICNGPFNAIINNLQQGTVNVFFGGGGTTGQPDLVLQAVGNPLLIPLGVRKDKNVVFVAAGTQAAQGTIFLEFY